MQLRSCPLALRKRQGKAASAWSAPRGHDEEVVLANRRLQLCSCCPAPQTPAILQYAFGRQVCWAPLQPRKAACSSRPRPGCWFHEGLCLYALNYQEIGQLHYMDMCLLHLGCVVWICDVDFKPARCMAQCSLCGAQDGMVTVAGHTAPFLWSGVVHEDHVAAKSCMRTMLQPDSLRKTVEDFSWAASVATLSADSRQTLASLSALAHALSCCGASGASSCCRPTAHTASSTVGGSSRAAVSVSRIRALVRAIWLLCLLCRQCAAVEHGMQCCCKTGTGHVDATCLASFVGLERPVHPASSCVTL